MTLQLPAHLERRLQLASAAVGLSAREYAEACVIAGLETHAEHDELVAAAFRYLR